MKTIVIILITTLLLSGCTSTLIRKAEGENHITNEYFLKEISAAHIDDNDNLSVCFEYGKLYSEETLQFQLDVLLNAEDIYISKVLTPEAVIERTCNINQSIVNQSNLALIPVEGSITEAKNSSILYPNRLLYEAGNVHLHRALYINYINRDGISKDSEILINNDQFTEPPPSTADKAIAYTMLPFSFAVDLTIGVIALPVWILELAICAPSGC